MESDGLTGFCALGSVRGSLLGRCLRLLQSFGDRQSTTKKLCDKDFAERSGELSGAICLKALVLLGNDPVTPRIVQKILWRCSCDFLALWAFFDFLEVGSVWEFARGIFPKTKTEFLKLASEASRLPKSALRTLSTPSLTPENILVTYERRQRFITKIHAN